MNEHWMPGLIQFYSLFQRSRWQRSKIVSTIFYCYKTVFHENSLLLTCYTTLQTHLLTTHANHTHTHTVICMPFKQIKIFYWSVEYARWTTEYTNYTTMNWLHGQSVVLYNVTFCARWVWNNIESINFRQTHRGRHVNTCIYRLMYYYCLNKINN